MLKTTLMLELFANFWWVAVLANASDRDNIAMRLRAAIANDCARPLGPDVFVA